MLITHQIAHHFDTDFCAHLSVSDHVSIKHNYPRAWANLYHQKNYTQLDPVINRHQKGFIFWEELCVQNLSHDQQQIMNCAHDFGIRSGLTFNLDTDVQSHHLFTLASLQQPEQFRFIIQKQFTKILAFVYILQKNYRLNRIVFNLTTTFDDYNQLSNIERAHQRQLLSTALTHLNMMESKTKQLSIPVDINSFFQSNYIYLRQLIVKWLEKLDS